MSDFTGRFVWYELMTTDMVGAEAFYRHVVGWGAQPSNLEAMAYTMFTLNDVGIGGLMAIPPDACAAGARPGWMGYVAVPDVDAEAARVEALGGHIHRHAADIPGVGRFAIVSDPQGGMLALFRGLMDSPPPLPPPGTPGLTGWHELFATDREAAFGYYEALFGWRKYETHDMGPMGIYQLYGTADVTLGGMMTKPPQMPHAVWLYYFNVDDIDAAKARVEEHGGTVMNGPIQVPGGIWILQCLDPQGAMFALVGPRV